MLVDIIDDVISSQLTTGRLIELTVIVNEPVIYW
jgi:hypothetical protein